MIRLRILSVLWLCLLCLGTATTASEAVHKSYKSETLGRDYVYNIYLPDGYQGSGLQYPVLYPLHSNLGIEVSWVGSGTIQQTADAHIDNDHNFDAWDTFLGNAMEYMSG